MLGSQRWSKVAALAAFVFSLTLCAVSFAAPSINNLSLRGLQSGETTRLTITGAELGPQTKLLLPIAIAEQKVLEGAKNNSVTMEVTLSSDTPAGIYPLRVVSPTGISPVMLVAIDGLSQLPISERVETLPVALHGNVSGTSRARCSFSGKKGQRVVVEVEAARLASKLDPVVRLYDSRGVQLAWGQAAVATGGDARLEIELPSDGEYTAELHDALFRGANPSHYRLKIGEFAYADQVFPLAARRGTQATAEAVNTNLPAKVKLTGQVTGNHAAPLNVPAGTLFSGLCPTILISETEEFTEPDSAAGPHQVPSLPVGISGRLSSNGEEDIYKLTVTPGAKLRFELYGDRIGSPLDGVLSIRNEKNGQLASSDDRPNTVDPGLEFTVPANVTILHAAVKDLTGQGGRDFVYRLVVEPANQPSLEITTDTDRLILPQGGNGLMTVSVKRKGYNGPIPLTFADLPAGIEVSGAEIPAGANQAIVSFTSKNEPAEAVLTKVSAQAAASQQPVTQSVLLGKEPAVPTWLRDQCAVSVVGPSLLSVAWQDMSADAKLATGRVLPLKVNVTRGENAAGPVRLVLVSSQKMPRKKIKENNKDVEVDDVQKALRLSEEVTLAADANMAEVSLLIPPDLPKLSYDIAVRAEQLSADGKKVLSSSVTPAVRLEAVDPPAEQPIALFADEAERLAALDQGTGEATLLSDDKYAGEASAKITGQEKYNANLAEMKLKIREFPAEGEYRFIQFAWKKKGGDAIAIQIAHDGKLGPEKKDAPSFRYHSGKPENVFGASVRVSDKLPAEWTVVTRDLFADFGEFTLTGFSLSSIDGEFALFDHVHVGRAPSDFKLVAPAE